MTLWIAGIVTFAAPLNPFRAVSEIATVPDCPCLIVTGFGLAPRLKSGPADTLTVTGTLPD